ncbi:alpha/beta fold hydrolase [Stenotrophobium rhamnosiphilum]|uniref:Alpha/beta hydrolase n=1 Tax=Stenotrophobium rhamnosiphilum TaxID=2029166 RepID=A0A2T5ME73_9GAMM|nr:alpha/beta fold hydrolase [Stenotrophobium rhamnosiphilum]PTU30875.1 alpha/beta hydrolase [Stenotrophobium rhamnosiphilum]
MTATQLVTSGDVRIAVYAWGKRPTKQRPRPTLVLVHGYPDSAEIWSDTAEVLAERFYVVAYDVRGAGLSTAPRGAKAYAFEHLTSDLRAVIDAVSPHQPVHLIGYDWGALQGWDALLSNELDGRIASFSAGAPSLDHVGHWFHERLRKPTPRHLKEFFGRALGSSYMAMFQIPFIPELTWKFGLGRTWSRVVSALEGIPVAARPSQTADGVNGLGLYRANLVQALLRPQSRTTDVPVQLIVMQNDPFVPTSLFEGMETTAPNLSRVEIAAGHWGLLSQPQALAEGISNFVLSIEAA